MASSLATLGQEAPEVPPEVWSRLAALGTTPAPPDTKFPSPPPAHTPAGIRSLLPLFMSMGGAQAVVDNPGTVLSVAGGIPGQIVGTAMENRGDMSDARGLSQLGAPRAPKAAPPAKAPEGPSLEQLMEQKRAMSEQRGSLDRQRATAVADRDAELNGRNGRTAGRGRNYDAKDSEVTRLTSEMSRIDESLSRMDGMISDATKRASPEYQMNAQKVREAEGVREQMLSEARKPFHEEFPTWSKVQAFAPAVAGLVTTGAQAAITALGNRYKVGKWRDAIDTANSARSAKARTRNADISEGYNTNVFPKDASAIKPYGAAATLGGLEGAALTNAPEVYNAFLPPLNQEKQAYLEYIKRLPADHPERERALSIISGMSDTNPYRDQAMQYFTSPAAVATRTLVGAAEGVGGAMAGKTMGGLLEPTLPRAEADALAKSMIKAPKPVASPAPAKAKSRAPRKPAAAADEGEDLSTILNGGMRTPPGRLMQPDM